MRENLAYYRDLAAYYRDEALERSKLTKLGPRAQWAVLISFALVILLAFAGGKALLSSDEPQAPTPTPIATVAPQAMLDLKGLSLLEAQQKLRTAGLENIATEQMKEFAGVSTNEVVIEQAPAQGALVKATDKILLRYGDRELYKKAKTIVTMPSVVGTPYREAKRKLQAAGYSKVTGDLPKGVLEAQAVIASQDPAAGTEGSLNDPVVLAPKAGFYLPDVRNRLQQAFAPYPRLAKVESPGDLNLRLTLKAADPSLSNPKAANERARSYKVGVEEALGYTVGKVYLVNPGSNLVGDSSKVERSATAQGLTKEVAREACSSAVQETGSSVEINWETGLLSELVGDQNISLTVTAVLQGENDSTQEVVASCVITGTNEAPLVASSSVK